MKQLVVQGVLIGVLATIVLDIWAAFVKHVLHLPTANWAFVGRWIGHMPRGVFKHTHVADSEPIRHELAIGWATHYAVGIVYGITYLVIVVSLLSTQPTLISALVFGLATIVAPWFIMQPGMGAGICASRTPRPNLMRMINVSMHTVFGLSLYAAWLLVHGRFRLDV